MVPLHILTNQVPFYFLLILNHGIAPQMNVKKGDVDLGTFKSAGDLFGMVTTPKTNMDTRNESVEEVTPLKRGNSWYLC